MRRSSGSMRRRSGTMITSSCSSRCAHWAACSQTKTSGWCGFTLTAKSASPCFLGPFVMQFLQHQLLPTTLVISCKMRTGLVLAALLQGLLRWGRAPRSRLVSWHFHTDLPLVVACQAWVVVVACQVWVACQRLELQLARTLPGMCRLHASLVKVVSLHQAVQHYHRMITHLLAWPPRRAVLQISIRQNQKQVTTTRATAGAKAVPEAA
mmetsp:Transcript_14488/g.26441  ORF Transcript_14488/g.26441 Transcript_14488/m.26441 type:complete len:209 (-) Transcript_14488:297-923(-)